MRKRAHPLPPTVLYLLPGFIVPYQFSCGFSCWFPVLTTYTNIYYYSTAQIMRKFDCFVKKNLRKSYIFYFLLQKSRQYNFLAQKLRATNESSSPIPINNSLICMETDDTHIRSSPLFALPNVNTRFLVVCNHNKISLLCYHDKIKPATNLFLPPYSVRIYELLNTYHVIYNSCYLGEAKDVQINKYKLREWDESTTTPVKSIRRWRRRRRQPRLCCLWPRDLIL